MKTYSKKEKILYTLLPFCVIFAGYFAAKFFAQYVQYFPPCPSYTLLHIICPGCGLTRSVLALLDGDILLSLRQNPLLITGIAGFSLMYVDFLLKVWGKKLPFDIYNNKAAWVVIALIALFTVARNIFPILAPI